MAVVTGPGIRLETVRIFTVLGIQFWDQALDQPVTDGLYAAAQPAGVDFAPVEAFRTGSGIYAFQHLPGLHDVEYPTAELNLPVSPAKKLPFVILVSDVLKRFLPEVFVVELPLDYTGVFLSNTLSGSPGLAARSYLFSAVTRPGVPGLSVVRADLWDDDADAPAAYAAIRVSIDGGEWVGIADEAGCAAVTFPTPLVQKLRLGSPPGLGGGPITAMSWPVQVRVYYQPSQFRFPLQGTRDVVWPWRGTPSLKSILDGQGQGSIRVTDTGPAAPEWTGSLSYGEDLVLRTVMSGLSRPSGRLFINRAI